MSVCHPPRLDEQVLHVHVAVNYAPGIGTGIGIAQETRDARTDRVICHWSLNKTHAKAWHYKDFETSETRQMQAFREGLGRVRGLYKRASRTSPSKSNKTGRKRDSYKLATGVLPREIVINCEQRWVVDLINRYLRHEESSFETILSDKVRMEETKKSKEHHQIRAVLKSIRRVRQYGVEVSVVRANSRNGAAVAAKRLAKQKRAEVCGKDQDSMD